MRPTSLFSTGNTAVLCFAVLILALQGCVQDDLSVCGISVSFKYTKHVDTFHAGEEVNKFDEEVGRIDLFVFNEAGILVDRYNADGSYLRQNALALNLMAGRYDFVAWGNLSDDFELTKCINGTTHKDEVILALKHMRNEVPDHPASLFHGALSRIEVEPQLKTNQHLTIDLMKNINNIRVIASGLPVKSDMRGVATSYSCAITSINGEYKFDNSIIGTNRLQYIPQAHVKDEERQLVSDFVVMRELNDGSTNSYLILNRKDSVNAVPVELFRENLPDILLSKSITGDLDIEHDFEIEIFYDETNASFSIKIEEWEDNNEDWKL